MIATGTDIKPLEVLLFMRPVKSRVLFEQMLGRGTRVISPTDLQAVTPDAPRKTHFVIVDAVGVVEQAKVDTQTLERKRSVPFDKLLEAVALGARDEDTLTSLAGRLARLERTLTRAEMRWTSSVGQRGTHVARPGQCAAGRGRSRQAPSRWPCRAQVGARALTDAGTDRAGQARVGRAGRAALR